MPRGLNRSVRAAAGDRIARWAAYLPKIGELEPRLMALADPQLRKESLGLRYRARSGEPLDRLLVEAFALVREAGRRRLGMRHFDVQLLGGAAIHHRSIVEMQTGEGKTLTATLPLYLAALEGKGAHLATVNDYLARRDAEWMGPLYEALGMSVGIIQGQQPQEARRKVVRLRRDLRHGQRNGVRLPPRSPAQAHAGRGAAGPVRPDAGRGRRRGGATDQPVQRDLHFMLVDEADSILIDEARTPLIISALPGEDEQIAAEAYRWAAEVHSQFIEDEHYDYDHEDREVDLTLAGPPARARPDQAGGHGPACRSRRFTSTCSGP